jgi:hypothetical protein
MSGRSGVYLETIIKERVLSKPSWKYVRNMMWFNSNEMTWGFEGVDIPMRWIWSKDWAVCA